MMNNISEIIAQQLATIKGKKGGISIEDVSGILEQVVGAITPGSSAAENFLRDEITKIAQHIQATKKEILALSPNSDSAAQNIGTAAVQLDAVVKATEEAAHTIMDAADEIQNIVATSTDDILKAKITETTARIYEACNFQDLTGQRIKKVMQALDFTETKIQRLINLFSSDGTIHAEDIPLAASAANQDMLAGPQLPGAAPSQADIDKMFGNLK